MWSFLSCIVSIIKCSTTTIPRHLLLLQELPQVEHMNLLFNSSFLLPCFPDFLCTVTWKLNFIYKCSLGHSPLNKFSKYKIGFRSHVDPLFLSLINSIGYKITQSFCLIVLSLNQHINCFLILSSVQFSIQAFQHCFSCYCHFIALIFVCVNDLVQIHFCFLLKTSLVTLMPCETSTFPSGVSYMTRFHPIHLQQL